MRGLLPKGVAENTNSAMKQADEPDKENDQPKPGEPLSASRVKEIDSKGDSQNPRSGKNKRMREPLSVFECWMIILTVLAIVVAGLTGGAVYWQAKIGAETLAEIKTGGIDTHTLAEAAKKQSENGRPS